MSDFRNDLAKMRRPSLLMRAARLGMADYNRTHWLKRLVPGTNSGGTSPETTIPQLLSVEERLEETRLNGDANYSITRHIEVLIALLSEARLLRQPAGF